MPEARGKITESQVDSIIKDYGTEGVKIIAVETENDRFLNYIEISYY